jgi:protein-arginine kinase activator protein McsA
MNGLISFMVIALSITMVITFFIMASRLKKIEEILDTLKQIELKKPENRRKIICEKCSNEFFVSVLKTGLIGCPDCRQLIKTEVK